MTARDSILRTWSSLRTHAGATPAWLAEAADLKVETGFGTAKLGLGSGGLPQLLLPVPSDARRPRDLGAPMLRALIERLGERGGATRSYLVVTCLDLRLERAFAELVEAVLGRIASGDAGMASFVSAVLEMRRLFVAPPPDKVEERRIRGLVAELILLERLTRLHPRAVELWFGPDNDRHDFRGGNTAIEVKSSARETGHVVISSVEQLAAPVAGTLHLRRYVLERTSGGGISVGTLLEAILEGGAPEQPVRERLAAMDCPDPTSDAWNHVSFNIERSETYLVTGDFPRVTPASFTGGLPNGVGGITYEIDLAAASSLRLGDSEVLKLEKMIVAGLA